MFVPVEDGVSGFELGRLRPNRHRARQNDNGQLDQTHVGLDEASNEASSAKDL
jgi:hypothetical protein